MPSCSCTFEEGELLEESTCHKGVSETEEKATEQQPCGTDVDRVRSGAHKTHCHLWEARKFCVQSLIIYHKQRQCDSLCQPLCLKLHLHQVFSVYLRSQVKVTVHRQYRVCIILGAEWK